MTRPDMPWLDDYFDVVQLARWLIDTEVLTTASDVLAYFEKPWKWNDERDDMLKTIEEVEREVMGRDKFGGR